MTEAEVVQMLKRLAHQAGGQKAFAVKHGLSAAYVNDVLHRRRGPGAGLLAALGLRKREAVYERVEAPDAAR